MINEYSRQNLEEKHLKQLYCLPGLRVRTVAKRHLRSSMFTASFYSGSICQTTAIFGITKDGSLVFKTFSIMKLYHLQKTSFKMALTICPEW